MLRTGIVLSALLGVLSLGAVTAEAGPIDRVQKNQRARIHQGVESGALTRVEARRLGHEQRKVERMQRRAWSDGELSRAEKARLTRAHKRSSRHIYRAKHNRRHR